MGKVKKLHGEKQLLEAECPLCGRKGWKILLSHSGDSEIVLIKCMKCKNIITLVSDEAIEIECTLDC